MPTRSKPKLVRLDGRSPEVASGPAFVGIDPGAEGAVAVLGGGTLECFRLANATDAQVADFVAKVAERIRESGGLAMIEGQSPRPTQWWDKRAGRWQSSILKSTCLLWGSYRMLQGMLAAFRVPHEVVLPKVWQTALSIPNRAKPETDSQWKRRLREKAEALFPDEPITAATADAVLIAEHCRRARERR